MATVGPIGASWGGPWPGEKGRYCCIGCPYNWGPGEEEEFGTLLMLYIPIRQLVGSCKRRLCESFLVAIVAWPSTNTQMLSNWD